MGTHLLLFKMAANNGTATLRNIYAPVPFTTRGESVSINADPKGEKMIYTCGKSVVIRDIEEPANADLYQQHVANATAATYAPSGFYVASGDESGKLRIWDTVNAEHILANEFPVLSGKIHDIAWSGDSERIVVVGDGRERFGAAILAKTGSSVGSITGHSKTILSCSFKQNRPFRVATCSEDFSIGFHTGPPFKFAQGNQDHTRFVNCVRFSPDGTKFVAVASDMQGSVFDGKTGDKLGELSNADPHKGTIYSCSWSADSSFLLTSSADKSCKIWDMSGETYECVQTFVLGSTRDDMQVACLWAGEHLISVSLDGTINYLNRDNPDEPIRRLAGHNKYTTALTYDAESSTILSGSYDGRIIAWDFDGWSSVMFSGDGHGSQVAGMDVVGDTLVSVGMDDTLCISSIADKTMGAPIKLDSTPTGVAASQSTPGLFVASHRGGLAVIRDGAVVSTLALDNEPASVAINHDDTQVAVGARDGVFIYELAGDTLNEVQALKDAHRAALSSVSYSPDGSSLATCDTGRNIIVWDTTSFDAKVGAGKWCHHTARVNDIAWSPNGEYLASASLDCDIRIWSLGNPSAKIRIPLGHNGGATGVVWISDSVIATSGNDSSVKTWNIENLE